MGVPISNQTRRVVYAASGTGPYNFSFEILNHTDIAVYRDDLLLTLTTNYTVTINSNGTGSVTLTASPTGATQIAIVGNRTIQRSSDFVTGGDFFANTLNDELDQQTIFAQQNAEGLQRALQAPQTDPTTINMTLPRATVRANKVLSFDSLGNPNATELIGSYRGDWTAGTAYFVRDLVKDTSNGNIFQVNTAHTASGSLPISTNADAAKFDLIVDTASATESADEAADSATAAAASQSAAATSATNAASSASAASTSASSASTSATNASNSATAAASSASTASTAATNAGNSATAAATSATNASNSATSASTSASTATTQATNAGNSATAAATSATNASNSASAASTSATNASNSATAASTSATNAASSATSAASSATAAAASFDSFDDRYLGAKSSNPSVDNDGNALLTGAIYFNTVANEMRVWTGSAWQAQAASPDTLSERSFAATAGQTSYTFTGGYRVGYTFVWVNGVLLDAADITATNGTTITFTSALALNDEVRILSFKAVGSVSAADVGAVAKAGDTMTGALLLPDGTASAPALSNDGDTNTGIFFPAADTIAFAEGGVESMRIDASGNMGLGTTTPSSFDGSADNLVVGTTTGNNGITIAAGTAGASTINFADGTSGGAQYAGYIDYQHSGDFMRFGTTLGTERFRIGSAGQLGIGGANYGTSGQVLTSAGSGAAPTWSTISAGNMSVFTANGASVPAGNAFLLSSTSSIPSGWSFNGTGNGFTIPAGQSWVGLINSRMFAGVFAAGGMTHNDGGTTQRWMFNSGSLSTASNIDQYLPMIMFRLY